MTEQEFKIITERVKEKEVYEELKKPEELIIKEVIGERIEEGLKNLPPTISEKISQIPAPSQASNDNFQKEVQELVKIAFEKNIPYAVNLARKSGNYFLIDALHDALVEYYIQHSAPDKL